MQGVYSSELMAGGCDGIWKSFGDSASRQAVETVLLALKNRGPPMQDNAVLYADVSKALVQTANILSDSLPPDQARALADS